MWRTSVSAGTTRGNERVPARRFTLRAGTKDRMVPEPHPHPDNKPARGDNLCEVTLRWELMRVCTVKDMICDRREPADWSFSPC